MKKATCLAAAVLIGIVSLSWQPIVFADEVIPALASVPSNLPNPTHAQLDKRKQALQTQLATFQAVGNAFNAEKAENQTDAEYSALQAQQKAYIYAANAFNRDVAAAERAATAQMLPAPQPTMRAKTRTECVRDAGVQLKSDLASCEGPVLSCLRTEGVSNKVLECVGSAMGTAISARRLASAGLAFSMSGILGSCQVNASEIAKACEPAAGTCQEAPLKAHKAAVAECPAK